MYKNTVKDFMDVMATELIKVYVEAFGEEAWLSQTEEEQQYTLHQLLGSFLTVAKRNAENAK